MVKYKVNFDEMPEEIEADGLGKALEEVMKYIDIQPVEENEEKEN